MKEKRLIKTLLFCMSLFCMGLVARPVYAGEGYIYDEARNTYTIQATSGNITPVVNDIIEEMETDEAHPGTIVIQKGSYSMNLILVTKSYLTIQAQNANLKFAGSSVNGQYMVKATQDNLTGLVIEGGTWDGNKLAASVFNLTGDNVTIKDCTVKNGKNVNIKISDNENINLTHVVSKNSNYGIDMKNVKNVSISNSDVSYCETGMDIRYWTGNNLIKDCVVTNCTSKGMQVKESPTVLTISGGKICNNNAGISVTTGADLTVKGVNISGNSSNGISPVGEKGKKVKLTLENCQINKNGRHGVAAASYVHVNAKNCEMNENVSNGLMMRGNCFSDYLTDLTLNKNRANGVFIKDNSTCKIISKCTAKENVANGLNLKGLSTVVSDCELSQNKYCGIWSDSEKKRTITVKNSTISSNKNDGIYVSSRMGVSVSGCVISKNGRTGVSGSGGRITIKGKNTKIIGNKMYGACMRAIHYSGSLKVSKATIQDNGKAGLVYNGYTTGYCKKAKLVNNRTGIMVLAGASLSTVEGNSFKNHDVYGIQVAYSGAGNAPKITQCKKNTFRDSKAAAEISYSKGSLMPAGMNQVGAVTIDKSVRKGAKLIKGKASPGYQLTVTVKKKRYKLSSADNSGTYAIHVPKLKAKSKITVSVQDRFQNKYVAEKEL